MTDGYTKFFRAAFNRHDIEPYPYQRELAQVSNWPELLDVPTGLGKTAALTLAWLYKRGWRSGARRAQLDESTPRRLVWCLPMRVLVEQTEKYISDWLKNLGILGKHAGEGRVSVHVLMGGERDLKTWAEHPEEDMVLIGSQDMLLSRALMRGYGMSRYMWPIHFALLHNDCLWAYDEVQLMGAGLATSAQLEAFRREFALSRSSHSLWLSATLNDNWLATIDFADQVRRSNVLKLTTADFEQAATRLEATKALHRASVSLTPEASRKSGLEAYAENLCETVMEHHCPDSQTLVVLNRVDRAQALFQRIQEARPKHKDMLVHARFRRPERRAQAKKLASQGRDRIIVATQAIEAGVDISSKTLFTELAPWSSLVQRFGRCNRYGEHSDGGRDDNNGGPPSNRAQVFWIDIEGDENTDTSPYEVYSLEQARRMLAELIDVGPSALPPVDEERPLTAVLRRKDLLDLFNTDPDLSGFDVNVSDYIRDKGNPVLQVFWRDFELQDHPVEPLPHRDELCPISLGQWNKRRLKPAWYWDSLAGEWQLQPKDATPRPGMTLLLAAKDGGYNKQLGFVVEGKAAKEHVSIVERKHQEQHEVFGDDWRSRGRVPVLLRDHLTHTADEAKLLCDRVGESDHASEVVRAARWHDLGKAHEVFSATMHCCSEAREGLREEGHLAKSKCTGPMRHSRRHFRHELASMLAWLTQHDDPNQPSSAVDLIAYLILAHHGKVRMSLRAMPDEDPAPENVRFARGIHEGDRLPMLKFDGEQSREVILKLALMEMGEGEQGPSWTTRTTKLLARHGPFQLAWLESLVRLADWRATAWEQAQGKEGNGQEI